MVINWTLSGYSSIGRILFAAMEMQLQALNNKTESFMRLYVKHNIFVGFNVKGKYQMCGWKRNNGISRILYHFRLANYV